MRCYAGHGHHERESTPIPSQAQEGTPLVPEGQHTPGRAGEGIAAGTIRSLDHGDRLAPGAPLPEPVIRTAPFVPSKATGVQTRELMQPSAPLVVFHDADIPWHQFGGQSSDGRHAELALTVAVPDGELTPFPKVRAKTWRAQPGPWDADIYNGFAPSTAPT